jgi:hypothetical protein
LGGGGLRGRKEFQKKKQQLDCAFSLSLPYFSKKKNTKYTQK